MSISDMMYEERYGLGTDPVPVDDYVSASRFAVERDGVFKKVWLPVARTSDVPEPGDYYVIDLPILETSIIIVRDRSGVIRAFHNACAHRCNKLLAPGKGRRQRISCRFHGWSFKLNGELGSASNEELFTDFDKSKFGLRQIALDIWEGFIFINRDPQPAETLKEWLGEAFSLYSSYFDDKRLEWIWGAEDVKANWKLLLDASSESYHAPSLHGNTLRDAVSAPDNPHSRFNRIELYRYHRTGSIYSNPEYELLPTEQLIAQHATTRLYPAAAAPGALPPGINPDRDPNWAFDVLILFPNVFILMASGWYSITWIWPKTQECTDVVRRVYMFEPKSMGDVLLRENMMVSNREVFRQDLSTTEGTHEMMKSGAYSEILLCDEEVMIRHALRALDKFIEEHRD